MALTFSPSWPRSETRRTSLLCERTSMERGPCSCGERMERWERRELMLRRIGWESCVDCVPSLLLGVSVLGDSAEEMLET
jgi:hypothetical protein